MQGIRQDYLIAVEIQEKMKEKLKFSCDRVRGILNKTFAIFTGENSAIHKMKKESVNVSDMLSSPFSKYTHRNSQESHRGYMNLYIRDKANDKIFDTFFDNSDQNLSKIAKIAVDVFGLHQYKKYILPEVTAYDSDSPDGELSRALLKMNPSILKKQHMDISGTPHSMQIRKVADAIVSLKNVSFLKGEDGKSYAAIFTINGHPAKLTKTDAGFEVLYKSKSAMSLYEGGNPKDGLNVIEFTASTITYLDKKMDQHYVSGEVHRSVESIYNGVHCKDSDSPGFYGRHCYLLPDSINFGAKKNTGCVYSEDGERIARNIGLMPDELKEMGFIIPSKEVIKEQTPDRPEKILDRYQPAPSTP